MGQADAGDKEAKLMTKLAPEWVRTSDPVIRSPARYRWTTAPAYKVQEHNLGDPGTLPTESVLVVRMLHMLTDSAMAATVALLVTKFEGTTFVRVKILYYHDILPYPLPIHL